MDAKQIQQIEDRVMNQVRVLIKSTSNRNSVSGTSKNGMITKGPMNEDLKELDSEIKKNIERLGELEQKTQKCLSWEILNKTLSQVANLMTRVRRLEQASENQITSSSYDDTKVKESVKKNHENIQLLAKAAASKQDYKKIFDAIEIVTTRIDVLEKERKQDIETVQQITPQNNVLNSPQSNQAFDIDTILGNQKENK